MPRKRIESSRSSRFEPLQNTRKQAKPSTSPPHPKPCPAPQLSNSPRPEPRKTQGPLFSIEPWWFNRDPDLESWLERKDKQKEALKAHVLETEDVCFNSTSKCLKTVPKIHIVGPSRVTVVWERWKTHVSSPHSPHLPPPLRLEKGSEPDIEARSCRTVILCLLVWCLEKVPKNSPKRWFDGDLPWHKVKIHLEQIRVLFHPSLQIISSQNSSKWFIQIHKCRIRKNCLPGDSKCPFHPQTLEVT